METEFHNEHDVDLALRRYDVLLRYLTLVRQMTWTKTQLFLALNLGLLTLTGALEKVSFIGTGWVAAHAVMIVAGTGLTASALWSIALRRDAKEVDRCVEVCRDLERVALEDHQILQSVRKGSVLSTHGILSLLFSLVWFAIIDSQFWH